jgi:hypothetical protein
MFLPNMVCLPHTSHNPDATTLSSTWTRKYALDYNAADIKTMITNAAWPNKHDDSRRSGVTPL